MSLLSYRVDMTATKRYIQRVVAKELASLSEPCYYPKTKRFYYELLNTLKLSDNEFRKFVIETYKGTKAEKWVLFKDVGTNILIYCMYLFLRGKDIKSYFTTLVYYMIVQYSRLMNKQIRYCYPETFEVTLSSLSKLHLFVREKGIANALYFLAKEVDKRFRKSIQEWNIDQIILFIGISRHRISQSVKSFAEAYYCNRQSKVAIKTQLDLPEAQSLVSDKSKSEVIANICQKLTVYKSVDMQTVYDSSNFCHLDVSKSDLVIKKLTNVKYHDLIQTILIRISKLLLSVEDLCSKKNYMLKIRSLLKDRSLQKHTNKFIKQLAKEVRITSSNYTVLYCFVVVFVCLYLQRSVCRKVS